MDRTDIMDMQLNKIIAEKDKEIEWLLNKYARRQYQHKPDMTIEQYKERIIDSMHQALKEVKHA